MGIIILYFVLLLIPIVKRLINKRLTFFWKGVFMDKNYLQNLAQETIEYAKKLNTKSNFILFKENVAFFFQPNMAEAHIEVFNESTVKAIHRYSGEKVGTLNFASAKQRLSSLIFNT